MRRHLFVILFGLAAIAIGVYEYFDLAAMEMQHGTRRVHSVIKILYEIAGKYGVLGFFGVIGAACLVYSGIKLARKPRREAAYWGGRGLQGPLPPPFWPRTAGCSGATGSFFIVLNQRAVWSPAGAATL